MRSWMTGLAAGILWVSLWPSLPSPVLMSAVLPGVCLPVLFARSLAALIGGICLGVFIGWEYGLDVHGRRLPDACVGEPLSITGHVASLPRISRIRGGASRQRFEFSVHSLDPHGCRGPETVLLSYYGPERLVPGEHWRFEVKLKRPWGLSNPGSHNLQAWFAETAIDATGSVTSRGAVRMIGMQDGKQWIHRLRQRIGEHVDTVSKDPRAVAVLKAITVADKSDIDAELWMLMQQLGVGHLTVISGLHIGMIAGVTYLLVACLAKLLPIQAGWAHVVPRLAALLSAGAYAALAGLSLSTSRAFCMLACFTLADLWGRQIGGWTTLLAACVAILILNPLAGIGSGFWLSFGAVAGLLWYNQWRVNGVALKLFGTHLFMSLAMVPAGAWWFGGASLVAAPANFLFIPLFAFIIVPAALLATLIWLCLGQASHVLWKIAGWPLEQLLSLARGLFEPEPGWLYLSLVASEPAAALFLLGVMLWAIPAAPASRWLAMLLFLPLIMLGSGRDAVSRTTRITVLDVGQGTAALVESGSRVLLYDTGGGDPAGSNMAHSVILPYLRQRAIRKLDTLIVSHPDLDHSSGFRDILRHLDVGRRYYGGSLPGMRGGQPCLAGLSWEWPGGQRFRFLSPAQETGLQSNDASCVLQLSVANRKYLFTGDIEEDRERELVRYWASELEADWMLAAHHGSRTSSSPTFLKHVQPDTVVISSGYANRFGHPHPTIEKRLRKLPSTLYSTAQDGALFFEISPSKPWHVHGYRWQPQPYWK